MTARRIVTVALLAFVVVTLGRMVADAARPAAVGEAFEGDRILAYYFHTDRRCTTCRNMQAWSSEVIPDAFEWRVVNFDDPEHAHFATDFELITASIVLVRVVDGERSAWRVLDEAWDLVADKKEFQDYVVREARTFLGNES